uniref:Uncharacterized protein n=1 Tax=Arundo donax TaxID=35708 RepID=A0A0A9A0G0_ARUDO
MHVEGLRVSSKKDRLLASTLRLLRSSAQSVMPWSTAWRSFCLIVA